MPKRPHIDVVHNFSSNIIAVELSKIGGWDCRFIAHLAPYLYIPDTGVRSYSKWKRLYIGSQIVNLEAQDKLGGIEIVPKLWIPDITIRMWEGITSE
ncbi:hypothetical protein [Nostoc sp. 'Peltigera membranacea cyanobiont' 213]|uniref:hypothetical protein n=1 Tax=Nostoc sp. 'Peltigera membranacea cyanobiont' 213 TaxID=2014530 RepID=UPI00117E09A1|nr:hypothetical protein [Nostoc sp. 'Peltigera membranacea cyanobiont' 213]